VPLASIAVPLSGVVAIAGGLSILLGYRAKLGAWLIVLFLIPVTRRPVRARPDIFVSFPCFVCSKRTCLYSFMGFSLSVDVTGLADMLLQMLQITAGRAVCITGQPSRIWIGS
jgi:hypothetical protein